MNRTTTCACSLTYVLKALESLFPDAEMKTVSVLEAPAMPPAEALARILLNDLDNLSEPFILVLDDCHLIHENAVHDLLAEILRHPPRAMHLAMLTRRDPPLPLGTLRARGQVNEIAMGELRFTRAETTEFLEKILDVSIGDSVAATLEETIEGWVTGLRLAALSMQHRRDMDRLVSGLRGGFQYITDYLVSEVLSQHPPAISTLPDGNVGAGPLLCGVVRIGLCLKPSAR